MRKALWKAIKGVVVCGLVGVVLFGFGGCGGQEAIEEPYPDAVVMDREVPPPTEQPHTYGVSKDPEDPDIFTGARDDEGDEESREPEGEER